MRTARRQFVGLETQCTTSETIDSHIKLINHLIILNYPNLHITKELQ